MIVRSPGGPSRIPYTMAHDWLPSARMVHSVQAWSTSSRGDSCWISARRAVGSQSDMRSTPARSELESHNPGPFAMTSSKQSCTFVMLSCPLYRSDQTSMPQFAIENSAGCAGASTSRSIPPAILCSAVRNAADGLAHKHRQPRCVGQENADNSCNNDGDHRRGSHMGRLVGKQEAYPNPECSEGYDREGNAEEGVYGSLN